MYSTTYEYLCEYDKSLDNFKSYQLKFDNNILKEGYHIIHSNSATSELIMRIENNLYKYNTKTKKLKILSDDQTSGASFLFIESVNNTNSILIACPWLYKTGFEIWYERSDSKWTKSFISLQNCHSTYDAFTVSQAIHNNGIIWLITDKGLIEYYYGEDCLREIYTFQNKEIVFNHGQLIDNKIIITTENEGLLIFDIQMKRYVSKETTDSQRLKLKSNRPIEIHLDSSEYIWLSHRAIGIDKYHKTELFNSISLPNSKSIYHLKLLNNKILAFNYNGKICKINPKSEAFLNQEYTLVQLNNKDITDFEVVNNGDLFISTYSSIIQLNKSVEDYSRVLNLDENQIFDIATDGNKLIIAAGGKIYSISSNSKFEKEIVSEKLNNSVRHIGLINNHTKIYFLSSSGIYIENQQTDTILNINDYPNCIYQDTYNKQFIVGTKRGLYSIDSLFNFKQILSTVYELGESDVYQIIEYKNNLYISCSQGIYQYDLIKKKLSRLNLEYLKNEYKKSILVHDEDIYVTQENVLYQVSLEYFNIKSISNLIAKVTSINGSSYSNISLRNKKLKLDSKENNLEFSFSIEGNRKQKNAFIEYKLEPGQNSWVTSQISNTISFTNLKPNTYNFKARGIEDNCSKTKLYKFSFTISPPYHQTWWFRSLIALSLLGVGFGFNYFRTRQQLKEKQIELDRQKSLQDQRNRMSRDLHDEMGSGLTKIKYLTKSVTSPEEKETSKQIDNLATNLIGNMRELLWSLDEGYDSSSSLFVKIREISNQYRKSSDLNIKTLKDTDFQNLQISGLVRRNTVLIVKECLTNVLKHANATKVLIKAQSTDKNLIITIVDNGIGFNTLNTNKSGQYGLNSIRRRIKDLNGTVQIDSNSNGTTILLSVPHLGLLLK